MYSILCFIKQTHISVNYSQDYIILVETLYSFVNSTLQCLVHRNTSVCVNKSSRSRLKVKLSYIYIVDDSLQYCVSMTLVYIYFTYKYILDNII